MCVQINMKKCVFGQKATLHRIGLWEVIGDSVGLGVRMLFFLSFNCDLCCVFFKIFKCIQFGKEKRDFYQSFCFLNEG